MPETVAAILGVAGEVVTLLERGRTEQARELLQAVIETLAHAEAVRGAMQDSQPESG